MYEEMAHSDLPFSDDSEHFLMYLLVSFCRLWRNIYSAQLPLLNLITHFYFAIESCEFLICFEY